MSEHLKIICPITCFPSDNLLDGGNLKNRMRIKKAIKRDAEILSYVWRMDNKKLAIKDNPIFTKAEVILTVFYKDKRKRDVHNLSVKTFLDSLVSCGFIEDDNINFIPKTTLQFGGYTDKQSYAVFEMKAI